MDANQILGLVSRWLHVIPVIILVGGTIFMRLALVPAASQTSASAELREAIRSRWAKLVMLSVLFLLITGLYNAFTKILGYELHPTYHSLVLVKLVVGFVIFFLASRLSGRSEKAAKFREQETMWLNILCLLMLALVLIAGYMRFMSTDAPKKVRTENAEVTAQLLPDSTNRGSFRSGHFS